MDWLKRMLCIAVSALSLVGASGTVHSAELHASISVITHQSVSVDDLSRQQLRRIFTRRNASWPDGQAITVFVFDKNSQTYTDFCKTVLQMFPYQLERQWDRLVYSGIGEKPISVSSEAEMIRRVSENPGSIGFTVLSDDLELQNIKVVKEAAL